MYTLETPSKAFESLKHQHYNMAQYYRPTLVCTSYTGIINEILNYIEENSVVAVGFFFVCVGGGGDVS